MHQRYFSPKVNLQKKQQTVDNYQSMRKQKSLKELILTKPKHNLIDKIQSKLASKQDLKIIDRTLFYLACYISHYQSLYSLITKGLNNTEISFNNFKNNQSQIVLRKNHKINCQKEKLPKNMSKQTYKIQKRQMKKLNAFNRSHQLSPNKSNLETPLHTQRSNNQSPEIKVILDSYRYKCLKEFFHLEKYSQTNIQQTVLNKIHQKIIKNQINTVEPHHAVSIKRISINYHKRQQSHPKNFDQTSKTNKKLTLFPEIDSPKFHLKKKDKNLMKKTGRFDNLTQLGQKSKPIPTQKSFKSESRRNGIHQVNKILSEIDNLKQALNCSFLQGDQVTNIASNIKHRLNKLLNHLKVKPINHQLKTKESQFSKIR